MSTVGIVVRDSADQAKGGDLVQARAIARYLSERGVTVHYVAATSFDPTGWDAAVLFNVALLPQTWWAAQRCRAKQVPYVVFPVFWNLVTAIPLDQRKLLSKWLPAASQRRKLAQRYLAMARTSVTELHAPPGRLIFSTERALVRGICADARAVCPNSDAELHHLAEFLDLEPAHNWTVIRNGIWASEVPRGEAWSRRREEVVCLGGLSPRKNSLVLVAAANQARVRLRIIGQDPARLDGYGRRIMGTAGPTVSVEGHRPHDAVVALLGEVKAHAQVGFVETPGLATLEAAAAGCVPVVAASQIVREYLPEGTVEADPQSVSSVATALGAAVRSAPPQDLSSRVRSTYDWPTVLEPLAELLGVI